MTTVRPRPSRPLSSGQHTTLAVITTTAITALTTIISLLITTSRTVGRIEDKLNNFEQRLSAVEARSVSTLAADAATMIGHSVPKARR